MSTWDQLDESQSQYNNDKAFWELDFKSDKELLEWLNTDLDRLRHDSTARVEEIFNHYRLYKGAMVDRTTRDSSSDADVDRAQVQRKIVINHLYDLTEQAVSRVTKTKAAVEVLPNNDEYADKQAAKHAKKLADFLKVQESLDEKLQRYVRTTKVAGEAYFFNTWNPDKGELHPAYKDAKEKDPDSEIPILDEDGKEEKDELTKQKLTVKGPVHIGDVELDVVRPEYVFLEDEDEFKKSKYFYKIDFVHVAEIKKEYPKAKDKIKSGKDKYVDQYTNHSGISIKNRSLVSEFYFKPSKLLPKGRYIKFTPDAILDNKEYPYSHGKFPCVRLTDIDIPGELYGRSFYINGRQIAAQINNITTMALRNMKWISSPKWMVPKGSAKLTQLHNNVGIVEFSGPQAPFVVTPSAIPAELLNLREGLKQDLQQTSGVGGTSRGEPPPGVKAGVAMQFLVEMENERNISFVAKYMNAVRDIFTQMLSVCGDYYDEEDKRFVGIFGKYNEYTRAEFDVKALSRPYSVIIQNGSALPESRAQKTQNIIDLKEAFPELLSAEQVADMLELGMDDKFYSDATAATRAAERENNLIIDKKAKQCIPQEHEYHIQHWIAHVIEIQKPAFRELPGEIQQSFKDHVLTHEMHMDTVARKNPTYLQRLQILPQFPLFYVPDHLAPQPDNEPVLDPMMQPGVAEDMAKKEVIDDKLGTAAQTELNQEQQPILDQGGQQ